ncbi:MAG: RNA 2',3'-cyclic phosphodiesterase [Patescibacteria group bacterium]
MRIFLAINLPETIKKELGEWQNEIKNIFPMEAAEAVAKWVAPENLHLTLLFLGEVGDKEMPFLVKAIEAVVKDISPIDLQLTKICYGPAKKIPPQFIWVKTALNQSLQKICKELGSLQITRNRVPCNLYGHDFDGHITLARVKEWVWRRIDPDEQPAVDREVNLKFTANSIEIMQSQLKRTGPEYTILQSFPLTEI